MKKRQLIIYVILVDNNSDSTYKLIMIVAFPFLRSSIAFFFVIIEDISNHEGLTKLLLFLFVVLFVALEVFTSVHQILACKRALGREMEASEIT